MKMIAMMAMVMAAATTASGQDGNYWVVETNSNQKDKSVVRIYDEEHQLVHEARLDKLVDVRNRKDRKMLNRLLTAHESTTAAVALNTTHSRKRVKKFDAETPVNVE